MKRFPPIPRQPPPAIPHESSANPGPDRPSTPKSGPSGFRNPDGPMDGLPANHLVSRENPLQLDPIKISKEVLEQGRHMVP